MAVLREVAVEARDPGRFRELLDGPAWREFSERIVRARGVLDGRTVWNVNSTAEGGGVAEMLRSLVAYGRGAEVDARWLVVSPDAGADGFFELTKRIHNRLHGALGDGGPLGDPERELYARALRPGAAELAGRVRAGDVVILHDPQTLGLLPALGDSGASLVWRCHVGVDEANDVMRETWRFLRPFARHADHYVFSRREYVWDGIDPREVTVVPPALDPFSPKNQQLEGPAVEAILRTAGLLAGAPRAEPLFERLDGAPGTVTRQVEMLGGPPPDPARPIVTQVSRWDALKDPLGVMDGFARHVLGRGRDAQLVLAGPATSAVADDPEGAAVFGRVRAAWDGYAPDIRERIALASLPMEDVDENAAIVNALQRRSDVVVQKSLAEGFGLTVSEAMWKARPVVATRVGGIQDQIEHGVSGLVVDRPADLSAFGARVGSLLADGPGARAMGLAARERVRARFLANRQLGQYAELIARLVDGSAAGPGGTTASR